MSQANLNVSHKNWDLLAISLSGLCLAHCLALPLFIGWLPSLGLITDNHLVHQVLAIMATVMSSVALIQSGNWRNFTLILLMFAGISLLISGAFIDELETHETIITITGASLLALMHVTNVLIKHRH